MLASYFNLVDFNKGPKLDEIVSIKWGKGSQMFGSPLEIRQDDLTVSLSNVFTYLFSAIPKSQSDLLIFPRRRVLPAETAQELPVVRMIVNMARSGKA